MPLTPADVHNVAFSKPPIGKRGYNEDEVDAFLDLVEAELGRLIEENNDLREQVGPMVQRESETARLDELGLVEGHRARVADLHARGEMRMVVAAGVAVAAGDVDPALGENAREPGRRFRLVDRIADDEVDAGRAAEPRQHGVALVFTPHCQ